MLPHDLVCIQDSIWIAYMAKESIRRFQESVPAYNILTGQVKLNDRLRNA